MSRIYPVDGHYDIDLVHVDSGWSGTFANIIRRTVEDITDEGPWSPCEVTLEDGTVLAGTLDRWQQDCNMFSITEADELHVVVVDEVTRFRA